MLNGLFYKNTYSWPDGHRIDPYGSGDFIPVCPVNGRGQWMFQLAIIEVVLAAKCYCSMCGAELVGPAVESIPCGVNHDLN